MRPRSLFDELDVREDGFVDLDELAEQIENEANEEDCEDDESD